MTPVFSRAAMGLGCAPTTSRTKPMGLILLMLLSPTERDCPAVGLCSNLHLHIQTRQQQFVPCVCHHRAFSLRRCRVQRAGGRTHTYMRGGGGDFMKTVRALRTSSMHARNKTHAKKVYQSATVAYLCRLVVGAAKAPAPVCAASVVFRSRRAKEDARTRCICRRPLVPRSRFGNTSSSII